MHDRNGGEGVYISADGRIVTKTTLDAAHSALFLLDPASGSFTSLGTYALGPNVGIGVVAEGSTPAFIFAKADATYRKSL